MLPQKDLFPLIPFLTIVTLFPGDHVSGSGHHHRVRRFIFTKNSKVSFDFNFLRPVPIMGQMDVMGIVEVPVSVIMDNDTFNWQVEAFYHQSVIQFKHAFHFPNCFPQTHRTPVSLPYFVMSGPPAPLPLPMFPSVFHSPEDALGHVPNHSYYVHRMVRRQASIVSSQHRRDILRTIGTSLVSKRLLPCTQHTRTDRILHRKSLASTERHASADLFVNCLMHHF
jgi:hypothetical protein